MPWVWTKRNNRRQKKTVNEFCFTQIVCELLSQKSFFLPCLLVIFFYFFSFFFGIEINLKQWNKIISVYVESHYVHVYETKSNGRSFGLDLTSVFGELKKNAVIDNESSRIIFFFFSPFFLSKGSNLKKESITSNTDIWKQNYAWIIDKYFLLFNWIMYSIISTN